MDLRCSDKLKEKVLEVLKKNQISLDLAPDLCLVERGYDLDPDLTCLVFDPLDYMEVLSLLLPGLQEAMPRGYQVTGLYENRYVVLEADKVLWLEANAQGVFARMDSLDYRLKQPLRYYEDLWQEEGFVRINKSQLVSLRQVQEIIPWFNARFVLKLSDGMELEVSKHYAKTLRKTLDL